MIKTIPKKKKCEKAKWLSEEALQIAVKRREVKSKGEKEKYKHLNAEFQRIARRDKKAFFSDQCKEIEENNRMGKTRDLFKKIRDTKGTFHAKMGTIKDRNGMDLTEAEDSSPRGRRRAGGSAEPQPERRRPAGLRAVTLACAASVSPAAVGGRGPGAAPAADVTRARPVEAARVGGAGPGAGLAQPRRGGAGVRGRRVAPAFHSDSPRPPR